MLIIYIVCLYRLITIVDSHVCGYKTVHIDEEYKNIIDAAFNARITYLISEWNRPMKFSNNLKYLSIIEKIKK